MNLSTVILFPRQLEVLRDILQEMGAGDEQQQADMLHIVPIPSRYAPRWHDDSLRWGSTCL